MDDQRFDALTKGLTNVLSRRAAWQRALGGVLGVLGVAATTADADAQNKRLKSQHCLPNQQVCRPANPNANTRRGTNHRHPCQECCSGYSVRVGRGRKCSCRPNGMKAKNRAQCCSGVRRNGRCVERQTPQPPPPPPAQCLSYEIEGAATRVPGGVTLESDCATNTYGALGANIPRSSFTFGDITRLQATFVMNEGTCEAGTPRFSLVAANGNTVFVDIGPDANPAACAAAPGTVQDTGNMIDPNGTGDRFYVNGVAMTYLEALIALEGEGRVFTAIIFVADPSHCASPADGRQVVTLAPCINVRP